MSRRTTANKTNIARVAGGPLHGAFAHFLCVRCHASNTVSLGAAILTPAEAYEGQSWTCGKCGFVHAKESPLPLTDMEGNSLPFATWEPERITAGALPTQRFWKSFFTAATEAREAYWKQCGTCGRILPARDFSKHVGWGPLEKQMECRACKAVINADLNPKRTKEQLYESSIRRRTAELLVQGENRQPDLKTLFERFEGKCFKTGKSLDYTNRKAWAVDHILPSRWLYPLTDENAALLSTEANNNKSDRWPSDFYTNDELIALAKITGGDLRLMASKEPVINPNIDVDACVTRFLTVRGGTDLTKRIDELKKLLEDYNLVSQLSAENKKLLAYT